jgi:hypothetical protein
MNQRKRFDACRSRRPTALTDEERILVHITRIAGQMQWLMVDEFKLENPNEVITYLNHDSSQPLARLGFSKGCAMFRLS